MNQKFFSLLILSVFAATFIGQAEAVEKRYKIKSGKVKYIHKSDGTMGGGGEEELIWDNFGAREKRTSVTKMKMFGMNREERSVNYIEGDWAYNLDPKKNEATKVNWKEMFKNMHGQKGPQSKMFSEEAIKQWGGVKRGTRKILNRKCTDYYMEDFGSTTCVHKGLPLMTEMDFMGMRMTIEAVSFEENVRIDPKELTLPEGVKIVDTPEISQQDYESMQEAREMMKQMRNSFKDSGDYKEMQKYQKQRQEAVEAQDLEDEDGAKDAPMTDDEVANDAVKKMLGGALKSFF